MLLLQDSIAEKKDPLKIYLLWGWQRLCLVLKQDIASFLPRFLPGLIKILTWELDISKPINEDPQEEEHPDLEASLKLIGTLVQDLGKYLGTHLLPIIQLLVSTVSNNALEEVLRGSAAEILPKILLLLQESSPKDAGEYGHYFIEIILNLLANELDAGFLKGLVLALKDSLGILGCYMQELELAEFCKKVIKVIYDSDQRKDREKEVPGVDDLDNEDLELMKEKIGLEEDLQVAVAQLIGILFKTYGAASLKLAEFLQVEVLPRVCHPGLSDKIHRLCLVLVDDMMQYLGRELLKDKWLIFPQYLFPFLLDPCCGVREAAFYGLGLFIAQAKEELQELADVFLEKFLLALDLKAQTGEKQRAFLHCQDNITAALGKMAFYHWEKGFGRKAFSIWVFHLPIRYEKFECYFQHEVLGTLALKAGVGGLKELGVLEQVVKVLAEVMDTRLVNQQGQEIVQECFIRWIKEGNDEDFQGTIERLGMLDKKKIENCLARQG